MEVNLKLDKDNFYKGVLQLMNFSLNLSNVEIDIISTMLKNKLSMVNISTREVLRISLDKSKENINNNIKRLKDKGILIVKPGTKVLYLDPGLSNLIGEDKVLINISNDNN